MTVNKAALLRTADWLEANRDKHIVGDLARTAESLPVEVTDPQAECFCALGRLAVEVGYTPPEDVNDIFGEIVNAAGLPHESINIYRVNDKIPFAYLGKERSPELFLDRAKYYRRGNPEVITLLRQLAA